MNHRSVVQAADVEYEGYGRLTLVGIRKECCAVGVNMCNLILREKLLNEAKTDMNIVMGLCVGHDRLFYNNE